MNGPRLNYPDEIDTDDERRAFDKGWASAMKLVSGAAREWANQLDPENDDDDDTPGSTDGGDGLCPSCGADMIRTMGSDDLLCPNCE